LEIDSAGDLIFRTYYMVDWKTALQTDSDSACISCGTRMKKVEPYRDRKGLVYDGLVCHSCKTIYWLKRD
jgi:uncharacterized protein with PIN domain